MKHLCPHSRRIRSQRRGNIILLSCLLMIVMVAFVAFAVDVGYLYVMRSQLQRTADAAAMAAAWELVDPAGPMGGSSSEELSVSAREMAEEYAELNPILNQAPALASDDVEVGYIENPLDATSPLIAVPAGSKPNAVRVRVQRNAAQNGRAPLFFARVLGYDSAAAEGEATAALLCNIGGFKVPADGSNLGILPYALDIDTWNDLVQIDVGSDGYRYDSATKTVVAGSDGVLEVNLFPQGTGSPGNRGTIDIGGSNNSTSDICRQIREGISPADMEAHYDAGNTLEPDADGEMTLYGDTGISAGTKDDLTGIVGQTRMIPLFSVVNGPGNNAQYTIVGWAGVRVMYIKLTGSNNGKKVLVQPCVYTTKGGIRSETSTSSFVYSPVWLVR
jgi:hypothetical protein